MNKEILGFNFKKIVPVELQTGTVYIRSLTLGEQAKLAELKLGDDMLNRFCYHVCDETGSSIITPKEAENIDSSHWVIINECIRELQIEIEKKVRPLVKQNSLPVTSPSKPE